MVFSQWVVHAIEIFEWIASVPFNKTKVKPIAYEVFFCCSICLFGGGLVWANAQTEKSSNLWVYVTNIKDHTEIDSSFLTWYLLEGIEISQNREVRFMIPYCEKLVLGSSDYLKIKQYDTIRIEGRKTCDILLKGYSYPIPKEAFSIELKDKTSYPVVNLNRQDLYIGKPLCPDYHVPKENLIRRKQE